MGVNKRRFICAFVLEMDAIREWRSGGKNIEEEKKLAKQEGKNWEVVEAGDRKTKIKVKSENGGR